MIITTTKILHSTVLKTLFVIFVTLILFVLLLAHGVHIAKIDLPGLKVKEFYIKLDKKLVIEIERVVASAKKESPSTLREMDRIGTALRYVPHLFDRIRVKELLAGGERIRLLYEKGLFTLETDRIRLQTAVMYDERSRVLSARVKELRFPGPGLTLRGRFRYDPSDAAWRGEGTYEGLNLRGNFALWHRKSVIGFDIDSEPTDSIRELVDYLAPPEPVKVWIYPKIPAKRYILHFLRGEVTLDKKGKVIFDPLKVEGHATAYGAEVHFHPDVPPVRVPRIEVTYRKNTLAFGLHEPRYEGKRLDGSGVKIRNLLGRGAKTELDAHIVVHDRFDESIRRILAAYRIRVPFVQTEGKMKATVDLTVALKKGRIVFYRGEYRSKRAVLLFDDVVPLPVENLHVLSEGLRFRILPCTVRFDPYLTGGLEGTLDLKRKRGDFVAAVRRLRYPASAKPLVAAKDAKIPVNMEFSEKILFEAPSLKARLRYAPGGKMRLKLDDLSLLRPYFRGALSSIQGGYLRLEHEKGKTRIKSRVHYPNEIVALRGKPFESFDIEALVTPGETKAELAGLATLRMRGNKTTIHYRDLDVNLVKLRDLLKPDAATAEGESTEKKARILRIYGKNSLLRTNYAYLPCDSYEMKITTRPFSTLFVSKNGKGSIYGLLYDDNIKVVGKNLSDRVVHGIPALKDLYGGTFDFDAAGRYDDFNGTITFENTLWAKSAVYNNILATVNTIPAILSLKKPGFNPKGFKIRRGAIRYHYKAPLFSFDSIAIEGESADIYGKGTIDFRKETIDVKMRIRFLETVSSTMRKIPIAGYILFGEDGRISLGLTIRGSLQKPRVETTAAKEIVTAPFNIIRRTITFPFHLFR